VRDEFSKSPVLETKLADPANAEYPGCGMDAIHGAYQAYAPILMMIAGADEEVSPQRCESFAEPRGTTAMLCR
jgi:dienelactone hydrolase